MARLMLSIVVLLALPLAPLGAQSAPSIAAGAASDDAMTAFAAERGGAGGGRDANADRGADPKGTGGRSTGSKNASGKSAGAKNSNAPNSSAKSTSARNSDARNTNAENTNRKSTNARNTNAKNAKLDNTTVSNTNAKSTNVSNTNVKNTNVDNTNVKNTSVNTSVAVVSPVRPLVPKPYYGTVVAGVTVGTLIVASTIPPAPSSQLCWYWANASQTQGYWDYCQ
jgi:hypothetical protein